MKPSGEFFNEFADVFDTFYDGKRSPVMRLIDQQFRSDMFERFRITFDMLGDLENKQIIDIGCGSGPYVSTALKRGAFHVTGLDPAPRMLVLAKQRVMQLDMLDKSRFITGYFPQTPIRQQFDYAIVMGVMDYVEDAVTFLDGLKTIVSGKAIISFPSTHWFRTPLRKVRYDLRSCPVYFYTVDKIKKFVHDTGIIKYNITKIPGAGMDYVVCLSFDE